MSCKFLTNCFRPDPKSVRSGCRWNCLERYWQLVREAFNVNPDATILRRQQIDYIQYSKRSHAVNMLQCNIKRPLQNIVCSNPRTKTTQRMEPSGFNAVKII
eukprot:2906992-Amphidinium_carterae.1